MPIVLHANFPQAVVLHANYPQAVVLHANYPHANYPSTVLTFAGHVLPGQSPAHDGVVMVLHPPTAQPHVIETRGVSGLPTK